jgi:putative nucleotidyltransferase with HDIG domain
MPEEQKELNPTQRSRIKTFSQQFAVKILIACGTIVLLALMFPRSDTLDLDYQPGGIWTRSDLFAPFAFPISRDKREYEQEVEAAKARVYPVFKRDETAVDQQTRRFDTFFQRLREAVDAHRQFHTSARSPRDSARFAQLAEQLGVKLREQEWDVLIGVSDAGLDEMRLLLSKTIKQYLRAGILDVEKKSLARPEIALRKGTLEEIHPAASFFDAQEIVAQIENDLTAFYKRDNDTVSVAHKFIVMHLTPNVQYDEPATQEALEAALKSVPRTEGVVEEGELIVRKNDRITTTTRRKLDALHAARIEREGGARGSVRFGGILIHVAMVISLFGIYLKLFRPRIVGNNRRLALVALLILLEGFFAYLTRLINVDAPVEYLIFVPAASMLLTIIFDSRVGFYGTVIIAYLVAGIRGNDYAVALAALVAGALSVYTVRDVRNRTQIIRSLGFIFLGYALTILALGLEYSQPWLTMMNELTFALANSLISPVLTFGLLVFFEKVFKVTTDLTLIELSQFNHPLLKLLSEKAPGTYHHSLQMATLAEAAASAVGANEVLARVGALFHDVGKIEKPTYFVENQKGTRNRHDKLAPRMSSLILQNHVKKGIALAREYNLPQEVVDFIPQHHGTTRIDFFYRKAQKLAENSDDETKLDEINEQDYRYPGPKPQTKETGILMLADSIEAAARSLDDPSPQRLEQMIDELFKKRFGEGELDECPLTLKDLTKIKQAFLGVLVGVYHGRVKYPEEDTAQQQHDIAEAPRPKRERTSRAKQQPAAIEPLAEPKPVVEPSVGQPAALPNGNGHEPKPLTPDGTSV